MSGWDLKHGSITEYNINEDRIWALFNFTFSDSSKKRNTYKFGLIKALLDNIFNGTRGSEGVFFSYEELFARFAENYWNLVVKYDLRQMRKDGKSIYSKVETIFMTAVEDNPVLAMMEFSSIDDGSKQKIIKKVTQACKKYVVGALYKDFDGAIYSFNLDDPGIILNECIYEFMLKYKTELEKLNYYSWAKFLEQVNEDNAVVRVIDKLELSTPRRHDLSIYREILSKEFEGDICFYCRRKLQKKIHVDHFIPWSFVKDDKIWNFVLACPGCNERKNNKVPAIDYLVKVEERNKILLNNKEQIIQVDFAEYSDSIMRRMWHYAKMSGLKEYVTKDNLR